MIPALLKWASVACWATAAGFFAWYATGVARQITYVTLADGRRQERRLPLLFRLLLPLAPNLETMARGRGMEKVRSTADAMLVTAGYEGLLAGWEFIALKFLVPLGTGPVWCLLMHGLTRAAPAIRPAFPALCLAGVLFAYAYPMLWLRGAVRKRQAQILKAMPFVLDLLTLSVEAGLDFMSAMQRCTERAVIDPLGEELLRVIREIQVGTPRRKALKGLSERVNLPDMRSLVNALVQADELGVSIGAILRIQADQIRVRRFERAEKLANEAPVKLLAPLVVFIFPSVFLILLGPVVYRFIQQL
ncbi:MAG: type II secretion system F family protein [Kiritimatiellia bacterium]|jgi:pilus assembly protein TadC